MRIPRRGEIGFTLIELLIVVAILGVLAAVVIPNVGRFIGAGEEEAWETELSNLQTAVVAMMVDNALSTLPVPVGSPGTANMNAFPDATSVAGSANKLNDPDGDPYASGAGNDLDGYVLYQHDVIGDSANTSLVNYVATQYTKGTYSVTADGTVNQELTGYE